MAVYFESRRKAHEEPAREPGPSLLAKDRVMQIDERERPEEEQGHVRRGDDPQHRGHRRRGQRSRAVLRRARGRNRRASAKNASIVPEVSANAVKRMAKTVLPKIAEDRKSA